MKKILIVNNNMHIGGVQKALVNLLIAIHKDYDVTLLLFCPKGELMKYIPEDIKVISANSAYKYLGMTKYDTEGKIFSKIGRSFYAGITRLFGRKMAISIMGLTQKKLSGYDMAISYLHNGSDKIFYGGCNDFVLKHIDAKQKIAFLHCDYGNCGANTKGNAKQYAKFNTIAACSKGCAEAFVACVPTLGNKVMVVKNCHDIDRIKKNALMAEVNFDTQYVNIVTVARLGREKGVLRAIKALSQLGELNKKAKYYIIGDGIERNSLLELTSQLNMKDMVKFCGELENPYGYMKGADLLLIPSYSEAAPLVVGEAASLETPILSTKTSSAEEMIEETGFGWVCENSERGISEGLRELLLTPQKIYDKKEMLKYCQCTDEQAIAQFRKLIVR